MNDIKTDTDGDTIVMNSDEQTPEETPETAAPQDPPAEQPPAEEPQKEDPPPDAAPEQEQPAEEAELTLEQIQAMPTDTPKAAQKKNRLLAQYKTKHGNK